MLGLFDSGIGGLTVVKELLKRAPNASFSYLGDTARTPYGNKTPETITRYALQDAQFLINQGATTIVIACNSVSAVAIGALRERFPQCRFFGVIEPVVRTAGAFDSVGVIGTRATIQSGVYETRLREQRKDQKVVSVACPLFVPLVEEHWTNKPETKRIARAYLGPIRRAQVDALILGCTHYPLLKEAIRASLQKRVKIIDSPSAVLDQLEREAPEVLRIDGAQRYWLTDPSPHTEEIAHRWLGRRVRFEKATLDI